MYTLSVDPSQPTPLVDDGVMYVPNPLFVFSGPDDAVAAGR